MSVNLDQEMMLNDMGWTVNCHSPFEIQHIDGSFASGQAAFMCIQPIYEEWLEYQEELRNKRIDSRKFEAENLRRLYEILKKESFEKQLEECKNSVDYYLLKQHYVVLQKYDEAAECRHYEKKAIEQEIIAIEQEIIAQQNLKNNG
jgi:hypothetical protein